MNSGQFKKGSSPWNKGIKGRRSYMNIDGLRPHKRGEFKHDEETKKKISETKKKNPTRYWLGKKRSDMLGGLHHNWKGDEVAYRALHSWVQRELGKASHCVDCGRCDKIRYHWANISGEYMRDTKDYKSLCPKCHKAFDMKGGQN